MKQLIKLLHKKSNRINIRFTFQQCKIPSLNQSIDIQTSGCQLILTQAQFIYHFPIHGVNQSVSNFGLFKTRQKQTPLMNINIHRILFYSIGQDH